MGIKDWNAGIIRPIPVAPAGPYSNGSAKGVWTLDQVAYWQKQGLWPIAGNTAPLGLFAGNGTGRNVIESVIIPTTGNATDFGDLSVGRSSLTSCSSATRGVFAGGSDYSSGLTSNVMDYVTISSAGNATDFGDLVVAVENLPGGCSSSTRGVFAGGASGSDVNVIQYITIATTGNSTDFGDLLTTTKTLAGCASTTRGIFAGGFNGVDPTYTTNVIAYITIATTGNATDFGDLSNRVQRLGGCSNSTRGIFSGGDIFGTGYTNVIDYITIASTGNATDFGDLLSATAYLASCASSTRGLIASGASAGNVIQYVTIATTGNAVDFGDLLDAAAARGIASCSNVHGGL